MSDSGKITLTHRLNTKRTLEDVARQTLLFLSSLFFSVFFLTKKNKIRLDTVQAYGRPTRLPTVQKVVSGRWNKARRSRPVLCTGASPTNATVNVC